LTLSDIMFQEIRDYQKELHTALKQRRKSFYNYIHQKSGTGSRPVVKEYVPDNKLKNITQKTIDSLLLRGLLAHNEERFSDAVDIYSGILDQNISNNVKLIILIHRGMAYFSNGQHKSAVNDFSCVLEMEPDHTRARYYRSIYFRTEKKFTEAFKDLKVCIQKEPYNLEYLTARAETWVCAGNKAAAISDCNDILRINNEFKPGNRLLQQLKTQSSSLNE
ncbi:MAG: hypothetical protein L3J12_08695, partial [Spirochaetales bacterium]|nr:hypothetical protein [Spirochaetales bacterium]